MTGGDGFLGWFVVFVGAFRGLVTMLVDSGGCYGGFRWWAH